MCKQPCRDYETFKNYTKIYNYVQIEEFTKVKAVEGMRFPCDGVYLVWEWEMEECAECYGDENSDGNEEDKIKEEEDEDAGELGAEEDEDNTDIVHTLTFKCIGATKDMQQQLVLRQAKELLQQQKEVPVRLSPEPDNPYDTQAIAFQCFIDGTWHRVGYVVQEALQEVHDAMRNDKIKEVSCAWVKYLVKWTATGAGYYAGINITKYGQWSQRACRSRSTV